jgi:hypothetical protein
MTEIWLVSGTGPICASSSLPTRTCPARSVIFSTKASYTDSTT